jgi:predicted enzyme related to lactoylglutathione lyase
VLGSPVTREQTGSIPIGMLPTPDGGKMGCLAMQSGQADGVMVWFDVEGRLKEAVAAASANGGKILGGIHAIGEFGFPAEVRDSEGNRNCVVFERQPVAASVVIPAKAGIHGRQVVEHQRPWIPDGE